MTSSCAFFYEHDRDSGWEISVKEGDNTWIGSTENDKVSTIWVQPYCEVQLFQNENFEGDTTTLHGNLQLNAAEKKFTLDSTWNDELSSYKCHCNQGKFICNVTFLSFVTFLRTCI